MFISNIIDQVTVYLLGLTNKSHNFLSLQTPE